MTEQTQPFESISTGDPVKDKLNADLGMDVAFIEAQLRFRLDHSRMSRGEKSQLGYVFIDRQHNTDVAIVFDTAEEAATAVDEHPLVDSLVEEDCLECYTLDTVSLADLKRREIILP